MKVLRRTVEQVFGTFKDWMGYTHFLTHRLGNVNTEMSLNVLVYNLTRVMHILGFEQTMKAMLAMDGLTERNMVGREYSLHRLTLKDFQD